MLDQIDVGAAVVTADAVVGFSMCRQHDDAAAVALADLCSEIEAIPVGQADIQDDDVGQIRLPQLGLQGGSGPDAGGVKAAHGEVIDQIDTQRGFVLDDQDTRHATGS